MNKYVLGIDGMRCGGCEAHVQDYIRRNFTVKKVKASHIKNSVEIFSDHELSEKELHLVLDQTGYRIISFKKEEAVKKLFGWR